jgi:hypothetical protein
LQIKEKAASLLKIRVTSEECWEADCFYWIFDFGCEARRQAIGVAKQQIRLPGPRTTIAWILLPINTYMQIIQCSNGGGSAEPFAAPGPRRNALRLILDSRD